jgi:hypothetical protein
VSFNRLLHLTLKALPLFQLLMLVNFVSTSGPDLSQGIFEIFSPTYLD